MSLCKDVRMALKESFEDKLFKDDNDFSLFELSDNLFEPIDLSHQEELFRGKNSSVPIRYSHICSSVIFTYNIFGNKIIEFIKDSKLVKLGSYKIEYEKAYTNLFNHSQTLFDAVLSNESNNIYFFEIKFTEWICNCKKLLTENYLNPKMYNDLKTGEIIVKLIKDVVETEKEKVDTKGLKKYGSKYKVLDVFQIIRNTSALLDNLDKLAFYNKNIVTLNLLYWNIVNANDCKHLDLVSDLNSRFSFLEKEFNDFKKTLYTYVKPLFENKDIEFKINLVKFTDFISIMKLTEHHIAFLDRYRF